MLKFLKKLFSKEDDLIHWSSINIAEFLDDGLYFMRINTQYKDMKWQLKDGTLTITRKGKKLVVDIEYEEK